MDAAVDVKIAVSGKFSHPFRVAFLLHCLFFFALANTNGPNESPKTQARIASPPALEASPKAIFSAALVIQL
jgi:hypothetical protein